MEHGKVGKSFSSISLFTPLPKQGGNRQSVCKKGVWGLIACEIEMKIFDASQANHCKLHVLRNRVHIVHPVVPLEKFLVGR